MIDSLMDILGLHKGSRSQNTLGARFDSPRDPPLQFRQAFPTTPANRQAIP